MPFSLSKFPRKLIANEWLVESVPKVWYRLSACAPFVVGGNTTTPSLSLQCAKHNWMSVRQWTNGDKAWYLNGRPHRENGLHAFEWNGYKGWYVNGRRHRENGLPAIEWTSGHNEWWVNGQRHRENGLPVVECANGAKAWYVNGRMVYWRES